MAKVGSNQSSPGMAGTSASAPGLGSRALFFDPSSIG